MRSFAGLPWRGAFEAELVGEIGPAPAADADDDPIRRDQIGDAVEGVEPVLYAR
jgi:hypothetical protein